MKIVSFGPVGAEQPGILRGDAQIVPLGPLLVQAGFASLTVSQFLGMQYLLQPVIQPLVDTARVSFSSSGVRLGPPVPAPGKIIVTARTTRLIWMKHLALWERRRHPSRSFTLSRPILSLGLPIR